MANDVADTISEFTGGKAEGQDAQQVARTLAGELRTRLGRVRDPEVRAGIRRLLESFPDVEVVAEASSGREALELARLHRPDAILLDLSMPDGNGLDITLQLREVLPATAVVIMSMHTDLAHVRAAIERGARGFVVKDGAVAELELALRAAVAGQTFLSPQISGRLFDTLAGGPDRSGLAGLSPRQRDILARIGRGDSTKEIAAALGISVKTVETHRTRMMETLGCRRGAELLRMALRHAQELQPADLSAGTAFSDDECEWLIRRFLSTRLLHNGLICRSDDRGDPVIQLSPALISGPEEFEGITAVLRQTLQEAWKELDR